MMISAPVTTSASLRGRWLQVRLHDSVPPYLRTLLRQVEPFPAAVQDGRWQILAFNRGYDALFGLTSVPKASRNALLLYFTDLQLRRQLPEWQVEAPRVVGQFRAAMSRHPDDPAWIDLLGRLRQGSAEFERLWHEPEPFYPGNAPQRFLHPVVGSLRLTPYQLWSEPRPDGLVAVGYTPADATTAAKLRPLADSVRGDDPPGPPTFPRR
jgi:MmyB-like transcription regulator ligand binding domain